MTRETIMRAMCHADRRHCHEQHPCNTCPDHCRHDFLYGDMADAAITVIKAEQTAAAVAHPLVIDSVTKLSRLVTQEDIDRMNEICWAYDSIVEKAREIVTQDDRLKGRKLISSDTIKIVVGQTLEMCNTSASWTERDRDTTQRTITYVLARLGIKETEK